MARQWHPCWTRHCLILFGSFLLLAILQQPNINEARTWTACAAPAKAVTLDTRSGINAQELGLNTPYTLLSGQQHNVGKSLYSRSETVYQKREIVQDAIEGSEDEDTMDLPTSSGWQPNSKALSYQLKLATTTCNSDSPQMQGPAWNGTFASNSPDGVYPSQGRTCTWTLQAISNVADEGSDKNIIPYVIAINFLSPIQLVCGSDYLTLYDGADSTAPVLARLCGNIWPNGTPTIYSTGPQLTAVFSSRSQSPGSYGFIASWSSVDTTGYNYFTPRSQHAMAYDPIKDMVYIMGGTSLRETYMWDMLTYTFATNKWNRIVPNSRGPDPRYGHYAFMYNNDLYIYGGKSGIGSLSDIWKFNGKTWMLQTPINPEKLPVGRIGSSCVTVTSNNSTKLYVFGGLSLSGMTIRELSIYDMGKAENLWYALAPRIDPLTATPVTYWNGKFDPSSQLNTTGTDGDDANDTDDDDDGDDTDIPSTLPQYLPPVMYDPLTSVWAPAALMGDDSVVMYACQKWSSFDVTDFSLAVSGRVNHTMIMRPPGAPGGSKTAWTAYIFGGFDGTDRADMLNVTMDVVNPTPATTNNCRALRWCSHYDDCQNCNPNYCSYVNGVCLFDTDKAKGTTYLIGSASDVPKNGTIQDLIRQRPELKSHVLTPETCPARTILDLGNPFTGTMLPEQEIAFKIYVDAHALDIQIEIRTLPTSALNFKSLNVWEGYMNMYWRADHGLTDDTWNGIPGTSSPIPPDVVTTSDNIPSGDYPVITTIGGLNTSELVNRWAKYGGLDSSPSMSAKQENSSYIYFPAADPRRFSGYYVFSLTNHNPTALSFSVTVSLLDHPTPADKPAGTSFNMATLGFFMLGFIFAIVLLVFLARKVRQLIEDRDASHRAAEIQQLEDEEEERNRTGSRLSGGMATVQSDGSTLLKKPMYKIVVGVQDLDKYTSALSGSTLRYRMVRGDDSGSRTRSGNNRAVTRAGSKSVVPQATGTDGHSVEQNKRSRVKSDFIRDIGSTPLPFNATEEATDDSNQHDSTIASSKEFGQVLNFNQIVDSRAGHEKRLLRQSTDSYLEKYESNSEELSEANKEDGAVQINPQNDSLRRGWSLKSLGKTTSFKRNQKAPDDNCEEREALTSQKISEEDERANRSSGGFYDSEQEMMDLSILSSHVDHHQSRQQFEKHQRELEEAGASGIGRRRNPIKVQPLSVEPLPFHTGLVPRTTKNLRRYQKHLARQQQKQEHQSTEPFQESTPSSPGTGAKSGMMERAQSNSTIRSTNQSRTSSRNHPTTSMSSIQRLQPSQIRATRSQGSLREVHRVASRMAMQTTIDSLAPEDSKLERSNSLANSRALGQGSGFEGKPEDGLEAGIELRQLGPTTVNVNEDVNGSLGPPLVSAQDQQQQQKTDVQDQDPLPRPPKRKPIKMRGRQEFEPGPLLGMNYLIVFPGDAGSRRVRQQGDYWRSKEKTSESTAMLSDATNGDVINRDSDTMETLGREEQNNDTLYNTDLRLPPMAIGTIFVPDPVRWWAYKAKQVLDRKKFERQMKRMHRLKERELVLQPLQPAKTR
ncbi:hypothetical protein BGX27_003267 [Mortierella sp. AM989]|nr:hypothetical protein BGX27_003267 [Mortierella sp. AM989]